MLMPTLFDPDAFVSDLTMLLASSSQLNKINVRNYRRMRLQPKINWATLVTDVNSDGNAGCGVITLEPYARSSEMGVSGAIFDWVFPVVCMEQPEINDDPDIGIGITAFRLAQLVIDVAHIHADDLYGTLNVDRNADDDEKEFVLPGCIGRRTNFHILAKSIKTPLVSTIQITQVGSNITLSSATAGASIYYTTDGTFPANTKAINPATNLYTIPFAVSPGTKVRACGYAANMNPSETRALTTP